MIKSFKSKLLEKLLNDEMQATTKEYKKLRRRLEHIDSVSKIENLKVSGYNLHELKGDKKGVWSIKATGNWRITFRFEDGHAYDVNHEDYH